MKQIQTAAILMVLLVNQVLAQTETANHEKYWNYRDNLKRKYLYIGNLTTGGTPDLGRSIPIENRDQVNVNCSGTGNRMRWGDATLHQGYYIAALATEYELLRRAGKDLTATQNELYYAIEAVNRLDDYGESFLTYPTISSVNRNGFLIRDDVPGNFLNHFQDPINNVTCLTSERYYTDGGSPSNNFFNEENEMSQDQIIGLFFGFSFVKKFVDPNLLVQPTAQDLPMNLVTEVGDITHRIMSYITQQWTETESYHAGPLCEDEDITLYKNWTIKNPVTGGNVKRGNSVVLFSPLIASQANFINGNNYNANVSFGVSFPGFEPQCLLGLPTTLSISIDLSTIENLWLGVQSLNWNGITVSISGIPDLDAAIITSSLTIPTTTYTFDLTNINFNESNRQMLLSLVSSTNLWTKANTGRLAWDADMGIFDLVRSVLHGGGTVAPQADFFNLLNLAPCEGPNSPTPNNSAQWRSSTMWWKPTGSTVTGEFNGIDYMLLYNLYMLEYGNQVQGVTFENVACPCPAVPKVLDAYINPATHLLNQAVVLNRKFPEYLHFNNSVPEYLITDLTLINPPNLHSKTELIVCNNSILKAWSPYSLLLGEPTGTLEETGILRVRSGSQLWMEGNGQVIVYPNSKLIIESGATLLMRDNSRLIVHDNAHVIVEPGATFQWESPAQIEVRGSNALVDIYANTGILVHAGDLFRISKGIAPTGGRVVVHDGVFFLGSSSILQVEGATLVCNEDAYFIYHAGADIQLPGSQSVLGLHCLTHISDNATFTFTYPGTSGGHIQLGNMNMSAGNNCHINLSGQGPSDVILELGGFAGISDDFKSIILANGTITGVMLPTTTTRKLSTGGGPLKLLNCTCRDYDALVFYGQQVSATGCTFSNNDIGIASYLTGGAHHNPLIAGCTFQNCGTPVLTYGVGAMISNSSFTGNQWEGYRGCALNYHTYIGNCTFTDNNTSSIGLQIGYSAAIPASFALVNSSLVNTSGSGDVGMECSGGTLLSRCNTIAGNKLVTASMAVAMTDNGEVNMSNDFGGGFNDLSDNSTLMYLDNSYAELNNGANNFATFQPANCTLHGTACIPFISGSVSKLSCTGQPQSLAADRNHWGINASLLGTNTFALQVAPVFSCNDKVYYQDNNPMAPQACPSNPVVFNPPGSNPMLTGSNVSAINTLHFPSTPLNNAVNICLAKMDSSVVNGFKSAVEDLTEILNHTIPSPTSADRYILNLAYRKLMEAVSQANYFQQLPDSLTQEYQAVISLQDNKINQALAMGDYQQRYYTSHDKAAIYRLSGSAQDALNILTDMRTWAMPAETDYTDSWICYLNAEVQLADNQLSREEFTQAIATCEQVFSHRQQPSVQAATNKKVQPLIHVFPNPGNGTFTLKMEHGSLRQVDVFNAWGQLMSRIKPDGQDEITMTLPHAAKGIFVIKTIAQDGMMQVEKLVVE